jgi:catechol 2,3-dioxygenase-like lactoylglutathione lyase family enzyme
MFKNTRAFNGFAVDDIPKAKQFYGDTLGLDVTESYGILTLHITGDRETIVYPKPDHVPATYTILNFPVENIDAAVQQLTELGISLERFDGVDDRGVFRLGGPLIAWFKDPAGNILSVIEQS